MRCKKNSGREQEEEIKVPVDAVRQWKSGLDRSSPRKKRGGDVVGLVGLVRASAGHSPAVASFASALYVS